jgi:hypothetical protein
MTTAAAWGDRGAWYAARLADDTTPGEMIRSVRSQWFAAWLGMVALAMAALVPVETARASAPEAIVLCTGHGFATVLADQSGAPGGKMHDRAHCECCLHSPPAALAPNQQTVALRHVLVLVLPPEIAAARFGRAASKQPRAPPAV